MQVIPALAIATLGLAASSTAVLPRSNDEVRCQYMTRQVCSQVGCQRGEPASEYLLIPRLESIRDQLEILEIRRCDDKGCTPVTALAGASPLYVSIGAPEKGYLLKIATSSTPLEAKGAFTEIATLGLTAFVGTGQCRL